MEKKKNDFIAQGSILAIASILVRVMGMIYRIPMTAIIGDKGNGFYSYAYSVYTILLLLSSYSLPLAVSKMVSAKAQLGQWRNVKRVFICAIAFAIGIGTTFGLIVLIGAQFFTRVFFHSELAAIALRFMAPTILIMALLGVFRGFFQGLQNTLPTAVSQIVEGLINAIMSVVFAYFLFDFGHGMDVASGTADLGYAWGAAGGAIGTGAGALAGLIFCFILFVAYRKILAVNISRDKTGTQQEYGDIFRLMLSIALPVILSTALYNLIELVDGSLFNNIMASKGMEDVKDSMWGAYNAKALLLVHIPVSISSAMAVSLVPTLTAAYALGDEQTAKSKVHAILRFISILAFPSAVGLLVLANPIIKTLFSGDTSAASTYLQVVCPAVITFSFSTITNSILQGIDRMNLPVCHSLIAMAVHVVVLLILCLGFNMGIYGVIISYVIYALVITILNFYSISKILEYRPDVITLFVKPAAASGIMGILCFGCYQLLYQFLGKAIPMLISVVVAVVVYFAVAVKCKLLTESVMRDLPKGSTLIRIAKKCRLM
ncbi:MAG: polysaccharide biosynthesis C-terminal domain-containing protein [Lachnospiraceae bacterium]